MGPRGLSLLLGASLLLSACAAGSGGEVPGGAAPGGPAGTAAADDRPVLDLSGANLPSLPADRDAKGVVPAGPGDVAIAEVDGVPVQASEITRFLFRFDSGRALDTLNQILDSRALDPDAAALGASVPPE